MKHSRNKIAGNKAPKRRHSTLRATSFVGKRMSHFRHSQFYKVIVAVIAFSGVWRVEKNLAPQGKGMMLQEFIFEHRS